MSQQKQWIGKQGQALLAASRRARCTGLSGASKIAHVSLAFLNKHKKSIALTLTTLAAAGIVYGAGKVCRAFADAEDEENDQALADEPRGARAADAAAVPVAAPVEGEASPVPDVGAGEEISGVDSVIGRAIELAEDRPEEVAGSKKPVQVLVETVVFSTALNELNEAIAQYNERVKSFKKAFIYSAPTLAGACILHDSRSKHKAWLGALGGALGFASDVAGIANNIFDMPVEYIMRLAAHIPSPAILNPLRALKLKVNEKWGNVESIIRDHEMTQENLDKQMKDVFTITEVSTLTRLRNYIDRLSNGKERSQDKQKEKDEVINYIDPARELVMFIRDINVECYKDHAQRKLPRGIFMLGKPGTGKTYAAGYIEQETGCKVFYMPGSQIKSKWVAEGAQNVRELYMKAAAHARQSGRPAIVFIDEADVVMEDREKGGGDGNDKVLREILTQFLALLDGPDTKENVLVVCATNSPLTSMDPAILRRFTHVVRLKLPAPATCMKVLADAISKYPQVEWAALPEDWLTSFAMQAYTRGFAQANLYAFIRLAVDYAVNEKREGIERAFLEETDENALQGGVGRNALYKAMAEAEEAGMLQLRVEARHLERAFLMIAKKVPLRNADDAEDEEEDDDRDLPEGAEDAAPAAQAGVNAPAAAAMPDVHPAAQNPHAHARGFGCPAPQMALGHMFEQFVHVTQDHPELLQGFLAASRAVPVAQPAAAVGRQSGQRHHGIEQLAAPINPVTAAVAVPVAAPMPHPIAAVTRQDLDKLYDSAPSFVPRGVGNK
jgi:AAA+ superfamily predicted ATPase